MRGHVKTMKGEPGQSSIQFSEMGERIAPPVIVDLMARALAKPDLLSLAAGFTDNAVLPRELVRRFASDLTQADIAGAPLQYGTNQGRERLRQLTCDWLCEHHGERADRFGAGDVMIANGSQQALYLAAQVVCDPGDIVLVQEPSYFVCLEMLKGLGLRPVGVPCDASGAVHTAGMEGRLREIDTAGERERVKALYLVTYFGNPSSRSMPLEEKRAIAAVLERTGFQIPVIEDAAYRELYFKQPYPVPSVFSMSEYDAFPKLYLGTYTKPFATGLKVGYGLCSDSEWLGKMLCVKGHQDFGTAHFNQCLIERVLDERCYATHLDAIRGHYERKVEALHDALEVEDLSALGWQWTKPEGGLIFWLRGPESLDLSMPGEICQRCIDEGVLYVPGDLCFPGEGPKNCVRLSVGALATEHFPEAIRRFSAALSHSTATK